VGGSLRPAGKEPLFKLLGAAVSIKAFVRGKIILVPNCSSWPKRDGKRIGMSYKELTLRGIDSLVPRCLYVTLFRGDELISHPTEKSHLFRRRRSLVQLVPGGGGHHKEARAIQLKGHHVFMIGKTSYDQRKFQLELKHSTQDEEKRRKPLRGQIEHGCHQKKIFHHTFYKRKSAQNSSQSGDRSKKSGRREQIMFEKRKAFYIAIREGKDASGRKKAGIV